jgi:hypothetical protein
MEPPKDYGEALWCVAGGLNFGGIGRAVAVTVRPGG